MRRCWRRNGATHEVLSCRRVGRCTRGSITLGQRWRTSGMRCMWAINRGCRKGRHGLGTSCIWLGGGRLRGRGGLTATLAHSLPFVLKPMQITDVSSRNYHSRPVEKSLLTRSARFERTYQAFWLIRLVPLLRGTPCGRRSR